MKRLYKYILAAMLSLVLFTLPSERQYELKAQGMPTIDIANLLQNVLDFLTTLDSFDIDAETFAKLTEKIEQYSKYIEMFQQGVQAFSIVMEISEAAVDIADDLIFIKDATMYFYTIGARPSICIAAGNCFNEFKKLSTDISEDFNKLIGMFKTNTSGAEINLLLELDKFMRDYRARIISLSYHYRNELRRLYQTEMYYRHALSNMDFRKSVIY